MKRYIIYARRKGERYSVWTDTNDINQIEKHVKRIRELGYEAKVTDPKIEDFENKIEQGYLLLSPVFIGQVVYAIINDPEPDIKVWEVKAVHYDGKTWFAIDDIGIFYEVGSRDCITGIGKAETLLQKLKGEGEDE